MIETPDTCDTFDTSATFILMPINQRGFSPLLILIAATVILILVAGGAYFLQRSKSQSSPIPTVTPVSSIPPDQTPTPASASAATASPTPSPTPNSQPLTYSQISQPACSSSSCSNTTVLIITGTGFSANTQLSATGQTNGNPYTGVVSQVTSDGTQIYFDLQSLPCQNYTTTLTNPMPAKNSVTFSFYPNKC